MLIDSREERAKKQKRLPSWFIPAVGYAISIGCLIWVYKGFDWKQELPRLRTVDWSWLMIAISTDVLVYVTQGIRWNMLLEPVKRVPLGKTVQAIYIGLFANEVLPLRSGEVIRVFLQSRWTHLSLGLIGASAVIERIFDGIWLMLAFFIVSAAVELPNLWIQGGRSMGVGVLVLIALLGFVLINRDATEKWALRSRWSDTLTPLVRGLFQMGYSRSFYRSLAVSALYLLIQVVPIYALMQAYDLPLGIGEASVTLVLIRLGTVVPQAPGNLGVFQATTIFALQLFGIAKSHATGFATLLFLVITVPLWLTGFIALLMTRMRLEDLHREAHARPAQADPAAGA